MSTKKRKYWQTVRVLLYCSALALSFADSGRATAGALEETEAAFAARRGAMSGGLIEVLWESNPSRPLSELMSRLDLPQESAATVFGSRQETIAWQDNRMYQRIANLEDGTGVVSDVGEVSFDGQTLYVGSPDDADAVTGSPALLTRTTLDVLDEHGQSDDRYFDTGRTLEALALPAPETAKQFVAFESAEPGAAPVLGQLAANRSAQHISLGGKDLISYKFTKPNLLNERARSTSLAELEAELRSSGRATEEYISRELAAVAALKDIDPLIHVEVVVDPDMSFAPIEVYERDSDGNLLRQTVASDFGEHGEDRLMLPSRIEISHFTHPAIAGEVTELPLFVEVGTVASYKIGEQPLDRFRLDYNNPGDLITDVAIDLSYQVPADVFDLDRAFENLSSDQGVPASHPAVTPTATLARDSDQTSLSASEQPNGDASEIRPGWRYGLLGLVVCGAVMLGIVFWRRTVRSRKQEQD